MLVSDIDDRHKNNLEGQLNLFDSPELSSASKEGFVLPERGEFPPEIKLAMEKEVTGLYVSGHPLAQYQQVAKQLNTVALEELVTDLEDPGEMMEQGRYRDGDLVKVLCIVTAKRTKIVKGRGYMAFVNIEDTTGSMEMLVFPQTYDRYRHLIEENQVLYIEGRLRIRDDEEAKLACSLVATPQEMLGEEQLEQAPEQNAVKPAAPKPVSGEIRRKTGKRPGLYLRVPSNQCREFQKAQQYLEIFEGEMPVYFFFLDSGKLVCAPHRLWISFNTPLYRQMAVLLGEENVALVEPQRS